MATSGSVSVTVTSWDTLKFSWSRSSYSIDNNTSTISWKLELISGSSGRISSTASKDWSVTINGTKYSGTNTIGISNNSSKTLASDTTTITHNSDGTKTFSFSFSQEFAITFSGSYIGTKSGSGNGTLDTIPRKSTLSVANGTLGKSQTLTVTKKSSSFTHTITATCGSSTITLWTKASATSGTFTPPLDWANQNTTGTTVSVKYTITTYNGSTNIGSNSYTVTCSIPSTVKPSVVFGVGEANTTVKDNFTPFVQGLSKMLVKSTGTGAYGSTIKSYQVTVEGKTYSGESVTTNTLITSGQVVVTVKVTDSRGRTATTAQGFNVKAYEKPQISELQARRCNEDGTANDEGAYCQVSFKAAISSVNNENTYQYKIEVTPSGSTETTTYTLTADGYTYDGSSIIPVDTNLTYSITVYAIDKINTTKNTISLSTAFTLVDYYADGTGISFGKVAEYSGLAEFAIPVRLLNGIIQPIIEAEKDLNEITEPNDYTLLNMSTAGYINCPITTATTGKLSVRAVGEEGQLHQTIKICSKTNPNTYERFYHSGAWGEWLNTTAFAGKILWDGSTTANNGYFMNENQTVTLTEAVSKQPHGIVLIFSYYTDGSGQDYNFQSFFISKVVVTLKNGKGHQFPLSNANYTAVAGKYLYIGDTTIKGNAQNETSGTNNGVTFDNKKFVLRYVIGV